MIFVGTLVYTQMRLENAYYEEIRSKALAVEINKALSGLIRAGTFNLMEKVIAIDKIKALMGKRDNWSVAAPRIRKERLFWQGQRADTMESVFYAWANIRGMVSENDPIYEDVRKLTNLAEELSVDFEKMSSRSQSKLEDQMTSLKVFHKLRKMLPLADEIVGRQDQIQQIKAERQKEERRKLQMIVFAGVLLNFALALALAIYFNRTTLSRISVLLANSRRLPEGKSLLPLLSGKDEIANLDSTSHEMAEKLNEARKRESAIITNSADVIFSLTLELEFSFISKASYRIWKYEPEELIGKPIESILPSMEVERVKQEIHNLAPQASLMTLECPIVKKDGSKVFSLWSVFRSDTEAGLFCVAHDISERKEMERMRNEFMTMISHDIRTPLTSLSMTYELFYAGALGNLNERGKNWQKAEKKP